MKSEYKETIEEMHQLRPTNIMEDKDTGGFQLFVNALESEANGEVSNADEFSTPLNEAVIVADASLLTPRFKKEFSKLEPSVQHIATVKYNRWRRNPNTLNFEPKTGNFFAIEITRKIHSVAKIEGKVVTWLWIGGYDEYETILRAVRNSLKRH